MAFTLESVAIATVFLPLIGAIIVGFNTNRITALYAQIITCAFLISSAIFAFYIFAEVIFKDQHVFIKLLRWVDSGNFKANWSIFIDPLTAVMLLVVTSVSALVHIYSVGYMAHDEFRQRFMCYLSLFTFCMLMLVTADNFAQLFFGWEGVG